VQDVILNMFLNNCLHQIVSQPTRLNNILDLFLTNVPQFVFDCVLKDRLGSSDHESVLLHICIPQAYLPVSITTQNPSAILNCFIVWNSDAISRVQEYLHT